MVAVLRSFFENIWNYSVLSAGSIFAINFAIIIQMKVIVIVIVIVLLVLGLGFLYWRSSAGPSEPTHHGCYLDSPNRVLPTRLGGWETVKTCGEKAAAGNYKYFGLEWPEGSPDGASGECWAGNTQPTTPATNCSKGLGGAWALDAYSH